MLVSSRDFAQKDTRSPSLELNGQQLSGSLTSLDELSAEIDILARSY